MAVSKTVLVMLLGALAASCNAQIAQNVTLDIDVLNYALFLENLESNFYAQGLSLFDQEAFNAEWYFGNIRTYVNLIYQHELAHVQLLNMTVLELGGTPVTACDYDFSSALTNVTMFLSVAATLESVGTSAYDGAIDLLTEPSLIQAAATIATVEARHTSWLRNLQGLVPFPNTVDVAYSPQNTSAIVQQTGFVVSCPFNLELLQQ